MSAQAITLILYLILTVLYLPLIVTLYRRPAGQENAAILLGIYIALASVFTLFEGLYRAGELYIATPRVANDFQIYGALFLSFLLTLAVAFLYPPASDRLAGIGIVLGSGSSCHPSQHQPLWGCHLAERKFSPHA